MSNTTQPNPHDAAAGPQNSSGSGKSNPLLRNVVAVVVGLVVGGTVNMLLITISHLVIPVPEGVDPADMESLKANIGSFGPKHFIMPFLAHALGTLVGAIIAATISASRHLRLALLIGAIFSAGGIMMAAMLPAPPAFEAFDLAFAYFPMGWLGWKLSGKPTHAVTVG